MVQVSPEGQALADAIAKAVGKVRLSVDTAMLFLTLSVKKVVTTSGTVTPLVIPPNTTLVLTEPVPQGQTFIIALTQLAFDQDQALAFTSSLDGNPALTYNDPSMFRMAYVVPLVSLSVANLPYAQRQAVTTIQNLTGASQNISIITFGGFIDNQDWKLILDNFFSVIEGVISGQAAVEQAAAAGP